MKNRNTEDRNTETPARRILVTGGAGFLGSHLCDRLLAEGNEVICLDNFFTGRKRNIAHLLPNPAFELVRHDVIDPFKFEVDQIYNLACPASPPHYQFNPIKTTKTSVMGAINCLGLAKRVKARVFQASTSEVYGDPEVHPQPESYHGNVNTIGIRACYDEGKRCAETLFFDYHRQNGVEIRVARIFNTYGPRMLPDDGRVVSNFIMQALRGEDLTIYGDGTQTRSFCYVDDLIEGFVRFMEAEGGVSGDGVSGAGVSWAGVSGAGVSEAGVSGGGVSGGGSSESETPKNRNTETPKNRNTAPPLTGPINLGNPGEFSMLQLAQLIIGKTGSKSKLTFLPLPGDDPLQRKPDITIAQRDLDWTPKIALDEGLDRTIEYFRS